MNRIPNDVANIIVSYIEFTITFKDVHVEERTNITFELYYDNPGSDVDIHVDKISFIQGVRKVCHQPFQVQAAQPRSSGIFGSKVLHYGTGSGDLNISSKKSKLHYR